MFLSSLLSPRRFTTFLRGSSNVISSKAASSIFFVASSSNSCNVKPILLHGVSSSSTSTITRHFATKGGKKSTSRQPSLEQAQLKTNSSQHEEWVKFQQSISVEGFETGQKTEATQLGGKNVGRGGKTSRKKKERLRLEREGNTSLEDMGGGHFPALRYSDEETDRLLAQAYAAIPPRAGKRGTRNLKRQRIRMGKKREQHAIYKTQTIKTHERRMEYRSRIAKECRVTREGSEEVRQRDLTYQQYVLHRWAACTGAATSPLQQQQQE